LLTYSVLPSPAKSSDVPFPNKQRYREREKVRERKISYHQKNTAAPKDTYPQKVVSSAKPLILLPTLEVFLDRLEHLIAQLGRLGKPRGEIGLDALEFVAVGVHVAEGDAFGPVLWGGEKKRMSTEHNKERDIRHRKKITRVWGAEEEGGKSDVGDSDRGKIQRGKKNPDLPWRRR
jgi:hypothetical protein